MSFNAQEISAESGEPIELYDFRLGSDQFRFTSNQTNVVILGGTFVATAISRGKLVLELGEKTSDQLEVKVPSNNTFVAKYLTAVPGVLSTLTVYRTHRNDLAKETVVIFKGDVQTVAFTNNNREVNMKVAPITTARSRIIPRFVYSNLCNHMLYDARCKISENDASFEKFLNVSAVSADKTVLTVDTAGSFGSDFFEQGFIAFDSDFRMVIAQGGAGNNDLTIHLPFILSPLSQTVRCLAGCKLRIQLDCVNKFANGINFGGFPYVSTKNIFETGLD